MRPLCLTRKPFKGAATSNVVDHQSGALNIGACRVGSDIISTHSRGKNTAFPKRPGEKTVQTSGRKKRQDHFDTSTREGRWPANLILLHHPSCSCTGTQTVPGYSINRWTDGAKPFGGGAGHPYQSEKQQDEEISLWACSPSCPVGNLDTQTGYLKTGKVASHSDRGMWSSGADIGLR